MIWKSLEKHIYLGGVSSINMAHVESFIYIFMHSIDSVIHVFTHSQGPVGDSASGHCVCMCV